MKEMTIFPSLSCELPCTFGGMENVADLFYSTQKELKSFFRATVKMEHNVEEINVDDKTHFAKTYKRAQLRPFLMIN